LHSMLATKMGQVPAESYTKHMKHTNARSHDSKELLNDKCANTQLQLHLGSVTAFSLYFTAYMNEFNILTEWKRYCASQVVHSRLLLLPTHSP